MRWRVDREVRTKPDGGWDVEYVVVLHLARGRDEKRTLRVGYDFGAPTTMARLAARPYLDGDDLPKRLLVRRDGQINGVE